MIRRTYIEQVRRAIYNGQPSDDATITVGLVNTVLSQAIGIAAQKNYVDSIKLDGIAYINNSFYTTYKNLTITKDEQSVFKTLLPEIPLGLGANEGINRCILTDSAQNSYPVILMTESQVSFYRGMKDIPNKLLGYSEGQYVYFLSAVPLSSLTAKVTMISGGDSTDLNSTINVPADYFPTMTSYLIQYFTAERMQPVDATNDGLDAITTT